MIKIDRNYNIIDEINSGLKFDLIKVKFLPKFEANNVFYDSNPSVNLSTDLINWYESRSKMESIDYEEIYLYNLEDTKVSLLESKVEFSIYKYDSRYHLMVNHKYNLCYFVFNHFNISVGGYFKFEFH